MPDDSAQVAVDAPRVAVYRDVWLAASETFVFEPTLHFQRWKPVPIGITRLQKLPSMIDRDDVTAYAEKVTQDELKALRSKGFPAGYWAERIGTVSLVHAHFGPDALIARHIARDLGVPLVVSFHGYDVTTKDRDFARTGWGRSYLLGRRSIKKQAARFLPVSNFLRDTMTGSGWPADRVTTHYIGIDTDFWQPAGSTSSSATSSTPAVLGPDVVFVGRLVKLKGADAVIRAFAAAAGPDSRLHIVGQGEERAALEAQAAALGADLSSRVIFHGALDRTQIRELMHGARAVILASRQWQGRREALNLVALEGSACGLPVVGYASGGVVEVVRSGTTGLLVPEDDEAGLTAALGKVLGDDELTRSLGDAGRAMVASEFSMSLQAQRLERIFDEVTRG